MRKFSKNVRKSRALIICSPKCQHIKNCVQIRHSICEILVKIQRSKHKCYLFLRQNYWRTDISYIFVSDSCLYMANFALEPSLIYTNDIGLKKSKPKKSIKVYYSINCHKKWIKHGKQERKIGNCRYKSNINWVFTNLFLFAMRSIDYSIKQSLRDCLTKQTNNQAKLHR